MKGGARPLTQLKAPDHLTSCSPRPIHRVSSIVLPRRSARPALPSAAVGEGQVSLPTRVSLEPAFPAAVVRGQKDIWLALLLSGLQGQLTHTPRLRGQESRRTGPTPCCLLQWVSLQGNAGEPALVASMGGNWQAAQSSYHPGRPEPGL